ncbi:hypothetical protein LS73_001275 [Helicobacter muridarum]|uniref:Protein hydE n=1 Tax=Helicobacter muridarum TaxID=216 RepID=A0A099TV49_9HELI|nr:hypothetical protein [Helicobacter muridarum]TLE01345.1 hypothetical protein LS73_001275 [Helicobacter muridarum]STQ85266.1 Protein hydE [Helicobacter muridarum]
MKEEVIFIKNQEYDILQSQDSKSQEIESRILACIMAFHYTDSLSSKALIDLLKNLSCNFLFCAIKQHQNSEKDNVNNQNHNDDKNFQDIQITKNQDSVVQDNCICLRYETQDIPNHINSYSNLFRIFIYANSNLILEFCDMLSNELPLSLNFTFSSFEEINDRDLQVIDISKWKSFDILHSSLIDNKDNIYKKSLIPTVKNLAQIIDSNDANFHQISPFVTLLDCNIDSFNKLYNIDDFSLVSCQEILIESLANELLTKQEIILQCNDLYYMLGINPMNNDGNSYVIFVDLYNATSYLRLNDAQKKALASIEKPFIMANCKEVFARSLGGDRSDRIFAGLPSDCLLLLLLNLLQSKHGMDYIFFSLVRLDINMPKPLVCYKENLIINSDKALGYIVVNSPPYYLPYKRYGDSIFELVNANPLNAGQGKKRLIVCLSQTNPSAFWIESVAGERFQQILDINLSLNLAEHIKNLYGYKNGDRLLHNFAKSNAGLVQTWGLDSELLELIMQGNSKDLNASANSLESNLIRDSEHSSHSLKSNNLIDIFALIEQMLQLDISLIEYASKCVRDRGPRIDYKLIRVGDSIILDYPRILRSMLSFHLAGVEKELLCYGAVESLAEFIGTLAGDMLVNYGIDEIFICGDLLLWQCFLDKIVYAIPKNISLCLPNQLGIDYNALPLNTN